MKSIGTNVCMMLPTEDSWNLFSSENIVLVLPVDKLKWRKDKESVNHRHYFLSLDQLKKVNWEKITVPNSGFTLTLFSNYDKSNFHFYPKSYCDCHLVKIEHPDLERYPFIIATYVESNNLISLISKSKNVTEEVLSGNFCCINESGISGVYSTVFDVENPENSKMTEKKDLGRLISEGRGTTKWKIGYSYITKTEKSFIYLGEISKGWFKECGSGFGSQLPSRFDRYYLEKTTEDLSLVLDITNLDKEVEGLINSNSGGLISTFVTTYLTYLELNHIYNRRLKLIKRTTHPAVEIKPIFKNDCKNLKEFISDFYTTRYPKITGHELLIDYNKLGEEEKTLFKEQAKNIIENYVSNRMRYTTPSGVPSLNFKIAKDPDKLLEYLNATKPTYCGAYIYNVLDYFGEEEFKKISATCTF